jgi:hypothetical protein
MLWILYTLTFFAVSLFALFLMSCLALAKQADEQSERTLSVLNEKNAFSLVKRFIY